MPSLSALQEFRNSFYDIARERADLAAQNISDELPLPETEAVQPDNLSAGAEEGIAGADLNFSDFLHPSAPRIDNVQTDAEENIPDYDDLVNNMDVSGYTDTSDLPESGDQPPVDDMPGTPDELLNGLYNELGPEAGQSSEPLPDDNFFDETENLYGDLPESPPDVSGAETAPPLDLGGENADGSFTLDPGKNVAGELGEGEPLLVDTSGYAPDKKSDTSEEAGDEGAFDTAGEGQDAGDLSFNESDFNTDGLFNTGTEDSAGEVPDAGDFNLDIDAGAEGPADDFSGMDSGFADEDFNTPTTDSGETGGEGSSDISDLNFDMENYTQGGEDFDGDNMSEVDTSGLGFEGEEKSGEEPEGVEDSSYSDLDNLNFSDFSGETGEPTSEPDGFENSYSGTEAQEPSQKDEFDNFDIGTSGSEVPDSDFDGSDFTLPGIDDLLGDGKSPLRKPKPVSKKPPSSDIEEIQLSEEDLEDFRKTLSGYPLNLRIACEELIAEHVLPPDQLSKLLRFLIDGAPARETAAFASQILDRPIVIPRGFEKNTGEALEEEQRSFAYIFVHNFLPILKIMAVFAVLAACVVYLGYKFIYSPIRAESLYKRGYERIFAGEYQRANSLFSEAFSIHRKKPWFYSYAEAFRDERRYMLAEEKYDELLRYYPRDKKGVLDYAALETSYLMNYEKADAILHHELLDYSPNDAEGLLAAGDNNLAWADSDPEKYYSRYEEARFAYSRHLELYGWKPPVVERMLRYFIRTDNLKETLQLKDWFESGRDRKLSPPALAELGGYLLDKQLETVQGVPNEYVESIEGVRAMLLEAVRGDPNLPEPHYHLARYYHSLNNVHEERLTLENAVRAFDNAREESVRRRLYRIDTHFRYANLLISQKEFFPAEEQLVRAVNLYDDYLSRSLIRVTPQYGQLFAGLGDLEYFVKNGNVEQALNYYRRAERAGYSPPEIQYRMGASYYQLEDWKNALEYMFRASADLPFNRKLLFALGNASLKRGDYYAAQGYYGRLLDVLENQRLRLPILLPNDRPEFLETGERLMMARNNAGVAYEALARQTGNREYRSRALALYAESARAWDSITRNPTSMIRMRPGEDINAPGVNLGFLNANNALRPAGNYEPEIFVRIDKDALEPSYWEEIAPIFVPGSSP